MHSHQATFLVPCFNEKENLSNLILEFEREKYFEKFNLLIVENGSNDNSLEYLMHLHVPNLKFVRVVKNLGYGNGLVTGIASASTEFVGWIHADQHNLLSEIAKWDLESLHGSEFIKGYRKKRPFSQKMVSLGMEWICSLILGHRLRDINAQPSLYPKHFLLDCVNPPHDFSLDLFFYFNAKLNGLKEIRKDVLFVDRIVGFSNWKRGISSIFLMSLNTIKACRKLRQQSKC